MYLGHCLHTTPSVVGRTQCAAAVHITVCVLAQITTAISMHQRTCPTHQKRRSSRVEMEKTRQALIKGGTGTPRLAERRSEQVFFLNLHYVKKDVHFYRVVQNKNLT